MIIHNCRQNSEEWEALRRGIPSASEFSKIVMPSEGTIYRCVDCGVEYPRKRKKCAECKGENCGELEPLSVVRPSAQQDGYMYRLIAESMLGVSIQQEPNGWMSRGHDLEPKAVSEYEFITGNDAVPVGFCTTDDGLLGASPDRLVGDDGLLEAKCPSPWVHVRHMVTGDLEDDHKVQVQGQLLVTGYKWVDVVSYCTGFPTVIIRAERNESYISGMNVIMVDFVTRLHRTMAELIEKYGHFGAAKAAEAAAISDDAFDAFCRPVV